MKSQYIGLVRKLPPAIPAVKLSARSLNGKMLHRQARATRSAKQGFVVRLIPSAVERNLLYIASPTPLSTIRRKKSIRKKKNAPLRVRSPSCFTKYLKNTG